MEDRKLRKSLFLLLPLLLVAVLTACAEAVDQTFDVPTPEGTFSVDPLFREFYDMMGGVDILGPAISPLFTPDQRKFQYVQSGLMQFDADAAPSQRFHFAPLGMDMGIVEPAVPAPDSEELIYVDGHIIYSGFVPLYQRLGGARFVGRPLTEVHYNPEKQSFEQYFENLGFYWKETDHPNNVYLLAYGAWKCDRYCRHLPGSDAVVDIPANPPAPDRSFREVVARLGPDFTGFVLTDPYVGVDGQMEQIYVNLVLVTDPTQPGKVSFRPLAEKIGILPQPLSPAIELEGMAFWPIDGDLGHNVPQLFLDYITLHGGIEVSGPPVSELFLFSDQVFRQCFTNLCLDYHMRTNVPEPLRVRPAPLGYAYRDMFYQEQPKGFVETQTLAAITLQVWERYPFISSGQTQEIGASIFEGTIPLYNIEPILLLTLPDGVQKAYYFPPTGLDGQTVRQIEPIEAKNGTLIPYQVCISSLLNEVFCVKDSYVIWYNP